MKGIFLILVSLAVLGSCTKKAAPPPIATPSPPRAGLKSAASGPAIQIPMIESKDLKQGFGPPAMVGKKMVIHYTGWLANGKKFESSHDRNKPFEFVLGQGKVILGWDQGILGMRPGGVRKLKIPAELAYGAKGAGTVVPPNETLTYEIEVLKTR